MLGTASLTLLCVFFFFYHLDRRDLWSSHEGRAAQDAQSILREGCWFLPHLHDGRPELQKPPTYYWWVAVVASLYGGVIDAWAVRLPAAISALGCVLTLYLLAWRCGRPLAGFMAALILATSVHFVWLARTGRIDMPLTWTISLALSSFYLGSRQRSSRPMLFLAYGATAVSLLLKGPIGLVLMGTVLIVFRIVENRLAPPRPGQSPWRNLLCSFHIPGLAWGMPLILLFVVPLYLWVNHQSGGEFQRVFLLHHNWERGFGGSEILRAHPWWFYAPHLLGEFLPWSLVLPAAGIFFFRRNRWRGDAEARLGLTWFLTILLVLSLSRFKRADYLLPALPGAALFLGCVAEQGYKASIYRRRWAMALVLMIVGYSGGWWWYIDSYLPQREGIRDYQRFALRIRSLVPSPQNILFFRNESHTLAFHVGQPLSLSVQWEYLDALANRSEAAYVVMPLKVAQEWPRFLKSGRLEEVMRNTDLSGSERHEKPLVLLRTLPFETHSAP